MRPKQKVIAGFWQVEDVLCQIGRWMRVARAWHRLHGAKIAGFGDNIRDVDVTEGDKAAAQIQIAYSAYGYGIGDLIDAIRAVTDAAVDRLVDGYDELH